MTVGPGVRFCDIMKPLHAVNKQMSNAPSSQRPNSLTDEPPLPAVGICSAVSVIGATLGGGIGKQTAVHGLIVDHLLSARVVTATGETVNVSSTENQDLFWALRGAGSLVGIVSEATYRIHDQTNKTYQSHGLIFPLQRAETAYKAVLELGNNSPEVVMTVIASWDPQHNIVRLSPHYQADIAR
jgi:FAD/FMN-containing dehydrogenase